jgi:hypothetical protein
MRSQYNLLLSRITASGSHSANEDFILHAYDRCGVENRGKDVGLFYYYMTVKDKDLEFLTATLFPDESASETKAAVANSGIPESIYAKRQRSIRESQEKQQAAFTEKNMSAIKAFMSPGAEDNEALNTSIINKNNAIALESSNSAKYFVTLGATEESKVRANELNSLTLVMNNPLMFDRLDPEKQQKLTDKVATLLGLN